MKIRQESLDEAILVVPWWPQKPYFAVLMSMVTKIRRPRIEKDLIVDSETGSLPRDGIKRLKLIACVVIGKKNNYAYVEKLRNMSSQRPGTKQLGDGYGGSYPVVTRQCEAS